METSIITYLGELRTESVHVASQNKILTDAPVDNHGKGAAFSPTDLMATSLANCMLTVMGIKGNQEQMKNINGAVAHVTKVMYSEPRRVGEIKVKIVFPKNNFTEKEKKIYENTAKTCPVAKSLHPELIQSIEFVW
ncbi:MAG: OsmC family protein [Sphingobacteriaceae bacterium]|nr:OsmC family protein [Sphingobacteriaceae bacterium]